MPSKGRRKLEKQRATANWSDVPSDIVECIITHLNWADRIRIQAVCKAWSLVPTLHIPTIDRAPWAMTQLTWSVTSSGDDDRERVSTLIDPFSRRYHLKLGKELSKECQFFIQSGPCASAHGWVLIEKSINEFYLYSPFTAEVIKLPEIDGNSLDMVATFTLDATSPESVIFVFYAINHASKVCVKLCSAGDYSWKTFVFDNSGGGFYGNNSHAVHAVYSDGVFYCVFSQGQFGAFNVELKEWTILATNLPPNHSSFEGAKLILSGSDLLLWHVTDSFDSRVWKFEVLRFDFSEMRWVYENNLNNHVLFIGNTCFSVPAVGDISQLANTIFKCGSYGGICYGSISASRSDSLVFRKWEAPARYAMAWIQLPLRGIWRANDLINAA